ncbi:MAG: Hsp70 family protein [Bacteroidia bacterium]|nr:Hsp70 family protein [Bacteroidia bacterium]
MASHIYGIDFGTSNSVLAVLNKETGEITKTFTESSLIYFQDNENFYIGKQAIEQYLHNNMRGRLLKSVKTLLPQSSFTFTVIFGKKYSAEDLVCLILKLLKSQADEFTGENVTEVVLGRPVVFSEDSIKDKLAQDRLLKAARMAGFEQIHFQYEPIAAGFLYEQSLTKPELVLIGDFGGGTSDFTLMKLDKANTSKKDRKSDIIKTGGIHIGGDDMDSAIMWHKLVKYFGHGLEYKSFDKMLEMPVHIFVTLCEWDQMGFLKDGKIRKQLDSYYFWTDKNPAVLRLMNLIDHNLGFSLFQHIEKSKIELSSGNSATIAFNEREIDIVEEISLTEFEQIISKEITKTENYVLAFLEKQNVTFSQVSNVFLTGGTSSIPAVKNIFEKHFTKEKISSGDNFNSVALGLALSYNYLK